MPFYYPFLLLEGSFLVGLSCAAWQEQYTVAASLAAILLSGEVLLGVFLSTVTEGRLPISSVAAANDERCSDTSPTIVDRSTGTEEYRGV